MKNPKIKSHQLLFLDPDKGFAPIKTTNDNYIKYEEVNDLVKKMPSSSVITVFQHHRRIKFQDDFNKIKTQIDGLTQAIFWKNVMFIAITKSEKMNLRIKNVHMKYGKTHPIAILS